MAISSGIQKVEKVEISQAEKRERLSSLIHRIFDPARGEVTIRTIMKELDHHGMALVLIFFSLPSALPVPAPGYSTVLSVPLLCIGLGLLFGKRSVKFPAFISKKTINLSKLKKMRSLMEKLAIFLERFSRPRLASFVQSLSARLLIGLLICLLGVSMAIPIPGTNTLPAGGIFLIGFSLLEDDFLFLFLGFAWGLIALCFTALVIWLGMEGAKKLINWLILGGNGDVEQVTREIVSFATQFLA
ncbi:exopolysaccharide biosynthesis protein [bacterium]|jgi:hypothetical protein|nr:exopolysaccharide biosynthesis protein [bacterium]